MERMFMPFERESNTTASGVQGTGLGLTIVRNVLDLMEGELAVESAPGEGSTFTVDITFRQAPADVAAEAPRPSRGRGPVHRILLVEDNELNREIAVEILHEYGFLVDTAENGAIAVDKVQTSPADRYDLVLMEGFKESGWPKIEVVRKAVSEEPVSFEPLAIVGDVPGADFALDEPAALADWIAAQMPAL